MKMLEYALQYHTKGYCVIPIKRNKKPYIKWEEFQNRRPETTEIETWWDKWPSANIGVVTGAISNLCVVDVDSDDGQKALIEVVPDLKPDTQSPSGGYHYYFVNENGQGNATRFLKDVDFRGNGGYILMPPSVGENGNKYTTLKKFTREPLPLAVKKHLESVCSCVLKEENCNLRANNNQTNCNNVQQIATIGNKGTRDDDIFRLANHLLKGGMDAITAYNYVQFFADRCTPPFTSKETRIKIESALKRGEIKKRNLTSDIREWVSATSGNFNATLCYNEQHLATKEDKAKARVVLYRMVKEGLLEKNINKAGWFRKIEEEAPEIDIFSEEVEFLKLKFPLALEKFYRPMQKNIIVIAGTQDSGKTAFLLRFAAMNMNRGMKIKYQSSEMGSMELRNRLSDFEDVPLKDWGNVDFRDCSSNFQDQIIPDGINIIDYLEISDSFYQMGGILKGIYEKLNKGIAVVALQKDFNSDLGRGGTFSLEKPRLYVSITSDPPAGAMAKIVKCKNWASKRNNPNNQQCRFKIRNGNEIRMVSDWNYAPKKQKG